MRVSIVCQVINALHTKIFSDDIELPQVAIDALHVSAMPEVARLDKFTKTVGGKKLICYFGEETQTLEAVQSLVDQYNSPVDIEILVINYENGLQHGTYRDSDGVVQGDPTQIVDLDNLETYYKGENAWDRSTDFMWTMAGFKPRDLV